ncbi:MAG: FkbM family methyltransferase [Pseudomonadota bacterium]
MFERVKKSAAAFCLPAISVALRSTALGVGLKDVIWRFSQRYATYFGFSKKSLMKDGSFINVSSDHRVEHEIYLFGEWEPLFTRYLMSRPRIDGIFLDIGANIGYFSIIASSIFSEVHAVEASPKTAKRLRGNLGINGLSHVRVHEAAVGREAGFIDFFQDARQSGAASAIQSEHSIFEARVPIFPLEELLSGLDWSRVRFVKIDVEGFEAPVLESLLRLTDKLPQDVGVFVEYDPARFESWPAIVSLQKAGFRAVMLQGPYDRMDYLDQSRRASMTPVEEDPQIFCDLLLRRG